MAKSVVTKEEAQPQSELLILEAKKVKSKANGKFAK